MDEKKIAFITCVNDEEEYTECRYYLERLNTPDGYTKDIISIQEAPSMAAGYNAGMKSTDAKYKVYLHQDVFVKNDMFIAELIEIFEKNQQVGLVGVVGKSDSKMDAPGLAMHWDTGKVTDGQWAWYFERPVKEDIFADVWVADGLLLATQYDIPWREDVFDGWNFYDMSQCMEFRKAGFKVVVPWQAEEWCFHDALYSKYTYYLKYYKRFMQEYGMMVGVDAAMLDFSVYEKGQDRDQAIEEIEAMVEECFDAEDESARRERLRRLFSDPERRQLIILKEYIALVEIDCREEAEQTEQRFWQDGMSLPQLILKQRKLKHALKRLEYTEDHSQKNWIKESIQLVNWRGT